MECLKARLVINVTLNAQTGDFVTMVLAIALALKEALALAAVSWHQALILRHVFLPVIQHHLPQIHFDPPACLPLRHPGNLLPDHRESYTCLPILLAAIMSMVV